MKFRRPFRWVEDRREHLISGANCREHFYDITAYADARGTIPGLDAEITVDAGAYSVWPFTSCLEGTMAGRHLPGPYAFGAYRAHVQRRHQQASYRAVPGRRAHRHFVCNGTNGGRGGTRGRP